MIAAGRGASRWRVADIGAAELLRERGDNGVGSSGGDFAG
jgi:hypothetical protein